MTEQDIRLLVREAIAKHVAPPAPLAPEMVPVAFLRAHASHACFELPAIGSECIIEPSVTCNHCGYCKSYGH